MMTTSRRRTEKYKYPRALAETRERVREILGKPLRWRLVPIRIKAEIFERLRLLAPDGDVAKLLKQAVEKLISEANQ